MDQRINETADLIVIGGGAAGLMCAAAASSRGLRVTVLDPNRRPGRKLRITGKGRCNLTNNCDVRTILANIPGDGRFLYSALNKLPPADVMAWFEQRGTPVKTERGCRVFPCSDRADDVAETLIRECRENGVVFLRTKAKALASGEGRICGVVTEEGTLSCRAAAVCTGGLSYPLTGSTGDGYRFAKSFGHTITAPQASLVPLESSDDWCAEMQGFSLRNVTLSAYEDEKLIYRELGEMLFTHFGVSGPLVLSASAHMRHMDSRRYRLEIDLKPGLDEKKLDARLLRDFEKYANREFKNALADLAGHRLIPVLIRRHARAAPASAASAEGLSRFRLRQTADRRGHHHGRRRQSEGDRSSYDALQADARAVFCRRGARSGRLYRRLQSADRLVNGLHGGHGRLQGG